MNKDHTTIVGGGVIGLSIAWELVRRGAKVTLLERDRVGKAASRAGAGILPPANLTKATDPIDQLRGLSHGLFPKWAEELRTSTGIDSGFQQCGGWYLADTLGEQAAMLGMTHYWNELGIECESVSLPSLIQRESAFASWTQRGSDAAAWWVPGECQIRPPRYLRALEQACRAAGVELVENAAVTDIQSTAHSVHAFVGDRTYSSDSIVVCGGAWTGRIAESLHLEFSIVPIRGQMLLLKTDSPLSRSIINVGHRYVVFRDDGYTLVGSCEEETGFQLGTTDVMLESLREFAVSLLPALKSAKHIDAWSGLRPMTFGGFPMIGRAPGTSNVFVAAGHFRSGLHLSPGTAVAIADLIFGKQPQISLESFGVGKQQSVRQDESLLLSHRSPS
jgi:glycine oxidase